MSATPFPSVTAPRTSATPAISTTCRIVNAPDPTDVPKLFATSFAPSPNANPSAASEAAAKPHGLWF